MIAVSEQGIPRGLIGAIAVIHTSPQLSFKFACLTFGGLNDFPNSVNEFDASLRSRDWESHAFRCTCACEDLRSRE